MLNPLASGSWNYDAAAHLALRASFGEPPGELEKWVNQGLDSTLEHLLHTPPPGATPPDWAYPTREEDLLPRIRNAETTAEDRAQLQRQLNERKAVEMVELVSWWTQRMYNTPSPLTEKMTLFWHGHFATSAEKVNAYRMWLQNETLRMYALGNFGTLVKAISCDPAMLVWLDLAASQKEHPNENFARELMELFTLGEGHYTENDIKEAARAFTGYRTDGQTQEFRFIANQFDLSNKTFMGKIGPWRGDEIIDIILAQPQCAKFIAAKLWRFFAYDDPEPALVEALANRFRAARYEIRPLLKTIFASEEFYSGRTRNALVKSPVQYIVQARRTLGVSPPAGAPVTFVYRQLGQLPFYPPNVKGWDGGKSWINTASLAYRYELARELVNGILPEQVGLPKAPSQPKATPQHSATPAGKQLAVSGQMHPVANSPSPMPTVTLIPPPAPKPPSQLTGGLPVGRILTADDRRDSRRALQKLCQCIFQTNPKPEFVEKFVQIANSKPHPFDDNAIRDLAILMMSTPNYQVC
jgi:uncharacterized protein (DUF1800 family)